MIIFIYYINKIERMTINKQEEEWISKLNRVNNIDNSLIEIPISETLQKIEKILEFENLENDFKQSIIKIVDLIKDLNNQSSLMWLKDKLFLISSEIKKIKNKYTDYDFSKYEIKFETIILNKCKNNIDNSLLLLEKFINTNKLWTPASSYIEEVQEAIDLWEIYSNKLSDKLNINIWIQEYNERFKSLKQPSLEVHIKLILSKLNEYIIKDYEYYEKIDMVKDIIRLINEAKKIYPDFNSNEFDEKIKELWLQIK